MNSSTHEDTTKSQVFAWPFVDSSKLKTRGGFTKGSKVTLSKKASPHWLSLQKEQLSSFEKDRRAILSMTGDYRTSFQFIETDGFTENFSPARPYFSWTTEHVKLLEDTGSFISLQHILVMFISNKDGEEEGPFIMKHWRQDWSFEKNNLLEYKGNSLWTKKHITENEIKGKWIQSVFQVDDSPRYQSLGKWTHNTYHSTWSSQRFLRPLPRREFSVREDYNVLEGIHRITLNPRGWTHQQHNLKINREERIDNYIAQEIGFNRYERISAPDLKDAGIYWSKLGPYWTDVKKAWDDIINSKDTFYIKPEIDGTKLWQIHFKNTQKIENSPEYQQRGWADKIKLSIDQFVEDSIPQNEKRSVY